MTEGRVEAADTGAWAVAITDVDGRAIETVLAWTQQYVGATTIDLVTAHEVVKLLAYGGQLSPAVMAIRAQVAHAIKAHGVRKVVLMAPTFDADETPEADAVARDDDLRRAVEHIATWGLRLKTVTGAVVPVGAETRERSRIVVEIAPKPGSELPEPTLVSVPSRGRSRRRHTHP